MIGLCTTPLYVYPLHKLKPVYWLHKLEVPNLGKTISKNLKGKPCDGKANPFDRKPILGSMTFSGKLILSSRTSSEKLILGSMTFQKSSF